MSRTQRQDGKGYGKGGSGKKSPPKKGDGRRYGHFAPPEIEAQIEKSQRPWTGAFFEKPGVAPTPRKPHVSGSSHVDYSPKEVIRPQQAHGGVYQPDYGYPLDLLDGRYDREVYCLDGVELKKVMVPRYNGASEDDTVLAIEVVSIPIGHELALLGVRPGFHTLSFALERANFEVRVRERKMREKIHGLFQFIRSKLGLEILEGAKVAPKPALNSVSREVAVPTVSAPAPSPVFTVGDEKIDTSHEVDFSGFRPVYRSRQPQHPRA